MRRHGEYGSGKHGENRQQSAGKIQRHGEIRQVTTVPIQSDRIPLAVAEINQRHNILGVIAVRSFDLHINGTVIALDGAPHVGVLESHLVLGIVRGSLRGDLHGGKRRPIGQTGDAHVLASRNPSGNVARGTYGDAHIGFLVTGFGRNIDAAVYQLQHVRIGDHVFRTVHRSGGGDLIVRFPDG